MQRLEHRGHCVTCLGSSTRLSILYLANNSRSCLNCASRVTGGSCAGGVDDEAGDDDEEGDDGGSTSISVDSFTIESVELLVSYAN